MDEFLSRVGRNLFGRINGPMEMRLLVQPFVAMCFAVRDGMRDARLGRQPYGLSLLIEPEHRGRRLREGWQSVSRVFYAALIVDVVYQLWQLRWIYVGEALILAQVVAVIPYVLLRGPVNRAARLINRRRRESSENSR